MTRLWLETLDSSKTFKHWQLKKTSNCLYFLQSKLESKLLFALRIGELNFKMKEGGNPSKSMGECTVGSKCALGMMVHSTLPSVLVTSREHAERIRKFGQPLVYLKP